MTDFDGKVALVTGAASAEGMGFAAATKMAARGARLFLTDFDGDRAAERAADLTVAGYEAHAMRHDVTNEREWSAVLDAVLGAYGKIDILVNNAGASAVRMMADITKDDWDQQLRVNLDSVFLGCRGAISQMRRQGTGGSIINISSVLGLVGLPGHAAYSASKGGVRIMTKSIALECAADNIRVNSVHPGLICTEMLKAASVDAKAQLDMLSASVPMRRLGRADDVAAMVVFLASDAAGYITGAEFVVDGGLTAQ